MSSFIAYRPKRICDVNIYLVLLILFSVPLSAQRQFDTSPTSSGGPLSPDQATYDVKRYDMNLSVNPQNKSIAGSLTVYASVVQPMERFVLDLDNALSVSAVYWIEDSTEIVAKFEQTYDQIHIMPKFTIQPGNFIVARVEYSGKPTVAPAPPWIGGFTWSKTAAGDPWIATSNQNDGADLWWPCKDHPSDEPDSMNIIITVPKPLVVASNGVLHETIKTDSSNTYHWSVSNPINNYNVALNIAPYVQIDSSFISVAGETVPVIFYALPENEEKARNFLPEVIDHMKWFEKKIGPYPFRNEKYGIAETPFYGMEHQTIIAYGNNYRPGIFGYDLLHHHELGHEWWGNLVTAIDWKDFWLHEGICAYMHPLYNEDLNGIGAYMSYWNRIPGRIRNITPIAPRKPQTTTERYFLAPEYRESDGDIYNKGSRVLHTLRFLIGKEALEKTLRQFAYPDSQYYYRTDGKQCRFASTEDFIQILEMVTDREMDWFFEVYFRQTQLPTLSTTRNGNLLKLKWETNGNIPFPMPVPVMINGFIQNYDMSDKNMATIKLPPSAEVEIDPDNWILKEKKTEQPATKNSEQEKKI